MVHIHQNSGQAFPRFEMPKRDRRTDEFSWSRLSDTASTFKTALERCHKDLHELRSHSEGQSLPSSQIVMKLLAESNDHARQLLDSGYEVIAKLREANVSDPDTKSLEHHVKSYYDYCEPTQIVSGSVISSQYLQYLRHHLNEATKLFMSLKSHLTEVAAKEGRPSLATISKRIFIVHGHDEDNKNTLKNLLIHWGFEPVILAEEPHRGRSLLEKLLKHTSDVGFVFVLLTPDDVGATRQDMEKLEERIEGISHKYTDIVQKGLFISQDIKSLISEIKDTLRPRARQNVMFEYGLCIGYLGRERVCVLLRGDLEIPSDVLGFGYHSFDRSVSECEEKIRRELRATYDF